MSSSTPQHQWVDANATADASAIGALDPSAESQELTALKSARVALSETASSLPVFRSLLRAVYVVLDCSAQLSMSPSSHLPPTKHTCILRALQFFAKDFFSANPTSTLGLVLLTAGSASLLLPLSPGGNKHQEILGDVLRNPRGYIDGVASVSKGLAVAIDSLREVPLGYSREILLLYNSTSTHDPNPQDILSLPQQLQGS